MSTLSALTSTLLSFTSDLGGATETWCELLLSGEDPEGCAAAKERMAHYRKSVDRLNEEIRDCLAKMMEELEDEDEWDCGWEEIYSQTPLCCDWVWGNKPFEGNGVFYQTFGGGPSGGFVTSNEARNEVWRVYRNWGTPYKFTFEQGYVLDIQPNQTPPRCRLRKVEAEAGGAGDAP